MRCPQSAYRAQQRELCLEALGVTGVLGHVQVGLEHAVDPQHAQLAALLHLNKLEARLLLLDLQACSLNTEPLFQLQLRQHSIVRGQSQ